MEKEAEMVGQQWPVVFYLVARVPLMDYMQIPKMVEDRRRVVHSLQEQVL
jgi:hypothetical protein